MALSPEDVKKMRMEANVAAQAGDFARVLEIFRAFDPSGLTDSDKRLIELAQIHLRSV